MKKDFNFFILFNLSIIAYYFFVFSQLNIGLNHEILFSTPDSQSYLHVAKWIEGVPTSWTEDRPIFYPLIIFLCSKISLVYCLWFFQFLCWLFSVNFIFYSIKELTNNRYFTIIGTLVFLSNLSLIALTMHALTEIVTTFLLAWMMYFTIVQMKNRKELFFIHGIILFLSVLTVIKPVFYIPLLGVLFVVIPLFYLKKYLKSPIKIIFLILIFSPVFVQFTIMKTNHNSITISKISTKTLDRYFIAQGIQKIKGIDRPSSIIEAESLTSPEIIELINNNKSLYFYSFLSNLKENLKAKPTYLEYPTEFRHARFSKFMTNINSVYYYLHISMIFLSIILLYTILKQKTYKELVLFLIMFGLLFYYIFATGISFSQGDRLVIPSISVWICFYSFVLYKLYSYLFSKKETVQLHQTQQIS